MRGSRVKALRRAFIDQYGFLPPKTRRFIEPVAIGRWKRFWHWITRTPRPTQLVTLPSIWRRWKRLAKDLDKVDPKQR